MSRQSVLFLSVDDVTKVLGLRGENALHLLETLEQEGFIEKMLPSLTLKRIGNTRSREAHSLMSFSLHRFPTTRLERSRLAADASRA
jgi:hypothetical protein